MPEMSQAVFASRHRDRSPPCESAPSKPAEAVHSRILSRGQGSEANCPYKNVQSAIENFMIYLRGWLRRTFSLLHWNGMSQSERFLLTHLCPKAGWEGVSLCPKVGQEGTSLCPKVGQKGTSLCLKVSEWSRRLLFSWCPRCRFPGPCGCQVWKMPVQRTGYFSWLPFCRPLNTT